MKNATHLRVCAGDYNGESFTVFSEEEAVLAALVVSRLVTILSTRSQCENPLTSEEVLHNIALERGEIHWVLETVHNLD